jgi:WD40 repeat protein
MRVATTFSLLTLLAIADFTPAVPPAKPPRLDANGDPMPSGAIRRLGNVRFQFPDQNNGMNERYRFRWSDDGKAIALSPDGSTVATLAETNKDGVALFFLDTRTGKLRRGASIDKVAASQVRYTLDGKSLVLTGWDRDIYIDAETARIQNSTKSQRLREPVVAVSPDGKWMAGQLDERAFDASLRIWEVGTGKEIAKLPGRGASTKAIAFGPDAKRLLLSSIVPTEVSENGMSWGSNSKVALACIDVEQRKIIGQMDVGYAQKVALSPDGETVAVESADHRGVQIHHMPTGTKRCTIDSPASELAFAHDGRSIFSIGNAGCCTLWNTESGKKLRELDRAMVNTDSRVLGFSRDGKFVVAIDGGWDSTATIVVWQTDTGKRISRPPSHEGAVTCLAFTSDGKHIVSGSLDRTVRVWDYARGEHLRILATHAKPITAIAISPDDAFVASSSGTGELLISRLADGKTVAELAGLKKGAHALTFSTDGLTVLAGGDSGEVFGWSIATRQRTIQNQTGEGHIMDFGKAGTLLIRANSPFDEVKPEKFEVWRPTDKQPLSTITIGGQEKHGDVRCDSVLFSPDCRMIVSSQISTYQGIRPSYGAAQLRIWERATGQSIRTLAPTVTRLLAFSPNGRLLASGGTGRSGHLSVGYGSGVIIWDTVTGEKVGGFAESPNCVAFSPDGRHLASAGRDGSILIWEAPAPSTPQNTKAGENAINGWWESLNGETKFAYEAIAQMLNSPEQAVTLIGQRVQPTKRADPHTAAKHIKQLDSAKFNEREIAQRELTEFGDGCADFLSKALKGELSEEARRRLEVIVAKIQGDSSETLRSFRAVAVLEWICSPAAKEHLQTLSRGAPGARLTMEASAALRRIGAAGKGN